MLRRAAVDRPIRCASVTPCPSGIAAGVLVHLRADMKWALLVLLVGCKTSHTLEAREDVKLSDVEHAQASGERREGPATITTTVEEFEPSPQVAADTPPGGERASQAPGGRDAAAPVLIRRTVTVEQHGGTDETWRSSSDGLVGAEETMTAKKADTATPAGGCMLGLGFWGGIVIAALLAAAGLYLRFRPKP